MMLPLLGSWLCIAANNQQSLLSNVVFQKLGLWSYAIYLVHWPVLVYVHALGLAEYSFLWLVPILSLGILLHIFVERKRNYGYKFLIIYLCLVAVVVSSEKLRFFKTLKNNTIESFEEYGGKSVPEAAALKIGLDEPSFILHGDSHSRELVSVLHSKNLSFISNNQNNCYSLGNHVKDKYTDIDSETEKKCNDVYAKTIAIARKYQDIPIVVVQNWSVYGFSEPNENGQNSKPFHIMDDFSTTVQPNEFEQFVFDDIKKLAQDFSGRTIYIVGKKQENPYYGSGHTAYNNMLSVWARTNLTSSNAKYLTAKQHNYSINNALKDAIERINRMRIDDGKYASLVYVEPNVHCSNEICDIFINNTVQIYSDGHHYSFAGAEKAVSNLLKVMNLDSMSNNNESLLHDISQIRDVTYSELEFSIDESAEGRKFILRE